MKCSGFSLFEILVALAIAGILVAIACPSYQRHVAAVRRRRAVVQLKRLANQLEHARLRYPNYSLAAKSMHFSGTLYYTFQFQPRGESGFCLRAVPSENQRGVDSCALVDTDLSSSVYCSESCPP